jgi:hypothetical protein
MTLTDDVWKGLFTLGGALGGAIIGAVIKGYYDVKARDRKQLSVWKTKPTNLIRMASHIAPKVEILFDGNKVENLAKTEVRMVNTGNRALHEFQPVIEIDGNAKLILVEPLPPTLKQVQIKQEQKKVEVNAPFLNPREEILLRILTAGHEFKLTVNFRQPEVTLKEYDPEVRDLSQLATEALFTVIRGNVFLNLLLKAFVPQYRRYVRSLEEKSES